MIVYLESKINQGQIESAVKVSVPLVVLSSLLLLLLFSSKNLIPDQHNEIAVMGKKDYSVAVLRTLKCH